MKFGVRPCAAGRKTNRGELRWFEQVAGAFAPAVIVDDDPNRPGQVLAVDLDGDGLPDPVTTGEAQTSLYAGARIHPGTFGPVRTAPDTAPWVDRLVALDIDDDGQDELLATGSGSLDVFRPLGGARFVRHVLLPDEPGIRHVTGGDLDGDGDTDLVVTNEGATVAMRENLGGGVYGPAVDLVTDLGNAETAVLDVDADGDLDLVTTSSLDDAVYLVENLGGGTFAPAVALATVAFPEGVRAVDLDGDGDTDVMLRSREGLYWMENLGGAGLGVPTRLSTDQRVDDFDVGDLDGDGDLDVVFSSEAGLFVVEHRGGGPSGQFSEEKQVDGPYAPTHDLVYRVALVDGDGDGRLDLAYAADGGWPYVSEEDQVGYVPNLGGPFGPPVRLTGSDRSYAGASDVIGVDLDGDGAVDLIAAWRSAGSVSWFRNEAGCPTTTEPTDPRADADPTPDRGCGCGGGRPSDLGWLLVLVACRRFRRRSG